MAREFYSNLCEASERANGLISEIKKIKEESQEIRRVLELLLPEQKSVAMRSVKLKIKKFWKKLDNCG